jgi:hypothetical protein
MGRDPCKVPKTHQISESQSITEYATRDGDIKCTKWMEGHTYQKQ